MIFHGHAQATFGPTWPTLVRPLPGIAARCRGYSYPRRSSGLTVVAIEPDALAGGGEQRLSGFQHGVQFGPGEAVVDGAALWAAGDQTGFLQAGHVRGDPNSHPRPEYLARLRETNVEAGLTVVIGRDLHAGYVRSELAGESRHSAHTEHAELRAGTGTSSSGSSTTTILFCSSRQATNSGTTADS
jgi:hypothetical protein